MIRAISLISGIVIVVAATYAAVANAGGITSPGGVLLCAVALGLVGGSLIVGRAWSDRRFGLALATFAAIVAGEAFGLINTGDRIIAVRDAARAPHKELAAKRAAASGRFAKAEAAKAAADKAALDQAALPNCKGNCAALLTDAKTAADRELGDAREALAGFPAISQSATPLAQRLGLSEADLDLVAAALASLAVNGLGACLIAFAAHGARRPAFTPTATSRIPVAQIAPMIDAVVLPEPVPAPRIVDTRQHAARFAIENLTVERSASVTADQMLAAYRNWRLRANVAPIAESDLGKELAALFREHGFKVRGGALVGVALKTG